jgi:acylphosphatase
LNSTPARIRAVIRRRVVVHGRVQGVAFRYSVQRMALQRAITGWVANRADGTVEAVFEGEPEAVERLIAFCREGPRGAEVDHIEVTREEPLGETSFTVR